MYGAITVTAEKLLMCLTEMYKHRVKNIYYLSIHSNECTRTCNNHTTSKWGRGEKYQKALDRNLYQPQSGQINK
jgi:tRNA(Arg) A34 adenosine deaminase TadA